MMMTNMTGRPSGSEARIALMGYLADRTGQWFTADTLHAEPEVAALGRSCAWLNAALDALAGGGYLTRDGSGYVPTGTLRAAYERILRTTA